MIELEDDVASDEALDAMVSELNDLEPVPRLLKAHEYLLSFNRQCMYTKYAHALKDVNGENMSVWGFHTGGWSGAEEFIDKMMESPILSGALMRMDVGGHLYFNWEEA